MSVVIAGDSEVAAALRRCGQSVSGRELVNPMLAGAQHPLNRAKELCAVLTGNLRRSLHAEVTEVGDHDVEVAVGTDVVYARRIELGFEGTDSLGRTYHQSPRPYLRPALDETKGEVISTVARAVRQQLEGAVR